MADDTADARGTVVSVNVSEEKGTSKRPVSEIRLDERGIIGDAHAGPWHRQVSLLAQERIDEFVAHVNRPTKPGEFAENITTRGLDLGGAAPLDRFRINEVEFEVTQIGKACHGDTCAIYREVGQCVMPKDGIFCRVTRGGAIRPGDAIAHRKRPLRIQVITMSDRAAAGAYEDRSGPRVIQSLDAFFRGKRWHPRLGALVLPDDPARLTEALEQVRDDGVDAVFITGGTGVGPKDFTPDVVTRLADKTIPGIMEHIRLKFGAGKPNALLSRSVAAVCGRTIVYAMPGSARAVGEYMGELLKTFEHLLLMVHGLDVH